MRSWHKYEGAGNRFLLFDDAEKDFPLSLVSPLCISHQVDGLILSRPSSIADRQMVYFNADGSYAPFCGNGLRCLVHFLADLGMQKTHYTIESGDKVLTVKRIQGKISTHLPKPVPLKWDIEVEGRRGYVVLVGVPHLVLFAQRWPDVLEEGRRLRGAPHFAPDGVNVNFVRQLGADCLEVRTYERGVERETGACGTGCAAAAFVAKELGLIGARVIVRTQSKSQLEVEMGEEMVLTGPSTKIAEGSLPFRNGTVVAKDP